MGTCCVRTGYDTVGDEPAHKEVLVSHRVPAPRMENVVGEKNLPPSTRNYGGYRFEDKYGSWSSSDEETDKDKYSREPTVTDPGWSDDEDDRASQLAKSILQDKKRTSHSGDTPNETPGSVLFRKIEDDVKRTPRKIPSLPRHEALREKESEGGGSTPESSSLPRYKSHSTATNFATSTLSQPDLNQVLWCMASALYYHVSAGQQVEKKVTYDIFDEDKYPLRMKGETTEPVGLPRVKMMHKFINAIFVAERLPSECAILGLAYIERLMQSTGLTLCSSNWKRVVLGSLILASKVWEEQAVWNIDFLNVFPTVSVHDLNKLESFFLELISYNVSLKGSEYAKYYFELRELAEKESKRFPLDLPSQKRTSLLEKRTKEREKTVKQVARTASMDDIPVQVRRASTSSTTNDGPP